MIITAERLLQLEHRARAETVAAIAQLLDAAAPAYGLTDPEARAVFLGQAAYETDGFQRFEELLNYTHAERIAQIWPRLEARADELVRRPDKLANAAYARRNGNGDEASGDGWKYRGRGIFQLTGRANYVAAGRGLGEDLVSAPELVSLPGAAVRTALWFWRARGCGDAARAGDIDAVTRLINGPRMEGAHARRDLVAACRRIFV